MSPPDRHLQRPLQSLAHLRQDLYLCPLVEQVLYYLGIPVLGCHIEGGLAPEQLVQNVVGVRVVADVPSGFSG